VKLELVISIADIFVWLRGVVGTVVSEVSGVGVVHSVVELSDLSKKKCKNFECCGFFLFQCKSHITCGAGIDNDS